MDNKTFLTLLFVVSCSVMMARDMESWTKGVKRETVTSESLGKAIIPQQCFTNPDDSPIKVDTDILGNKRKLSNPYSDLIEVNRTGSQSFKVRPKSIRKYLY